MISTQGQAMQRNKRDNEMESSIATYLMIGIEKNSIATITNSNSRKVSSQRHYHKTCPSYSKSSHPFGIIIRKTTDIKLRKEEKMHSPKKLQHNHSTSLGTLEQV